MTLVSIEAPAFKGSTVKSASAALPLFATDFHLGPPCTA